jgi:hypothetical protein
VVVVVGGGGGGGVVVVVVVVEALQHCQSRCSRLIAMIRLTSARTEAGSHCSAGDFPDICIRSLM